jgi:uncharacterized protein YggU (UPF0235/DUF167 family)
MRITARVHPRSSSNRVQQSKPGECEVWVTAPPTDDRANDAVREALADFYGVAKSRVRLVRGAKSRIKIFETA